MRRITYERLRTRAVEKLNAYHTALDLGLRRIFAKLAPAEFEALLPNPDGSRFSCGPSRGASKCTSRAICRVGVACESGDVPAQSYETCNADSK